MTVLPSKFMFPDVKDIIQRDRLFALLDSHGKKNVVLVLGQAAQGKSTLIASYLRRSHKKSIWIHLDRDDSDPANFFDLIITALQQTLGTGSRLSGYSGAGLGSGNAIARYTEILSNLLGPGSPEINIVIDDFDALDPVSPTLRLIQSILETINQESTVFLLSRSLPPLGIQKLKIANRLCLLTNSDIAFTREETHQLFQSRHPDRTLSPADIDRIHSITDGWAGGLTLLAESIQHNPSISSLPEQLKGETIDFFAEEIFSTQPVEIRNFLVTASIFDVIEPDIMAAFFPSEDPLTILTELEKRNIFIHRLDQISTTPVFRFNKLFKTFLENILKKDTAPLEYNRMCIQAGDCYRHKGEYDTALKYYIKSRHWLNASELIKIIGTDRILRGKTAYLAQCITSLPEEMIWSDPWLIYFLTMTRRISGGRRNIDDFKKALGLFRNSDDIRGVMVSLAHLIEAAVFLQKPHGSIKELIDQGEDILIKAQDRVAYTYAKAILWLHIGFGCIAGTGDVTKGISACKNAGLLADYIKNKDLKYRAVIISILGYVQAGEFEMADRELKRVGNPGDETVDPEYRVLKNLITIELLLKKGEMENIEALLMTAEKDIEGFGLIFFYPDFVKARAMHSLYCKNFSAAEQFADHLSDISVLAGNPFFQGLAHRIRAASYYHRGDYLKAEIEAEKSMDILRDKHENRHYRQACILYGLILVHRKKPSAAQSILDESLAFFETYPSPFLYAEAVCGTGLALWHNQQRDAARQCIEQAIALVVQERYAHFMSMSPADFTLALLIYSISVKDSIPPHLISLLTRVYRDDAVKEIETLLAVHAVSAKRSVAARLKEIATLTLPTLTIQTFGDFRVRKNTSPPEEIRWEGSKPKLLLKSIIVHGGYDIPKEILIEDIWPETTESSGEKKFKVNLHRLRKSLEPRMGKQTGSSYLKLEGGYVSLDDSLVTVDVQQFMSLYAQGREHETIDPDRAVDCFEKALRIYRGEFLSEDPYADWAAQKRLEFSGIHMEILERSARIHEAFGRIPMAAGCLRKLIAADPLRESAYQWLMRLYYENGMKNSAIRIFHDCITTLKQEIDADPDAKTLEMYHRIQH